MKVTTKRRVPLFLILNKNLMLFFHHKVWNDALQQLMKLDLSQTDASLQLQTTTKTYWLNYDVNVWL